MQHYDLGPDDNGVKQIEFPYNDGCSPTTIADQIWFMKRIRNLQRFEFTIFIFNEANTYLPIVVEQHNDEIQEETKISNSNMETQQNINGIDAKIICLDIINSIV